jgi:alpha-D-ribose 1-methylphosphonate 5-triphosphate synthase subunit PhnH
MPATQAIAGSGFVEPGLDAQAVFRTVLDCLARPARPLQLDAGLEPPPLMSRPAAAIALALCDGETPIWLDSGLSTDAVHGWFAFQAGSPLAPSPSGAAFAFISDPSTMPPLEEFAAGTQEYPDRSTTLVLQVDAIGEGEEFGFSGPGIIGTANFMATGLPVAFRQWWRANGALFPRGVDLLLASPDGRLIGLPRTARLAGGES